VGRLLAVNVSSLGQAPREPPTVGDLRGTRRNIWEANMLKVNYKRRPFDPCQSQLVMHLHRWKVMTADITISV
jgi:hypothetical protein